jgi:hypothetical protein
MRYQLGTWLPWWFKRYIMRNKNAYLKPLYHFDKGVGGAHVAPDEDDSTGSYSPEEESVEEKSHI